MCQAPRGRAGRPVGRGVGARGPRGVGCETEEETRTDSSVISLSPET